MPICLLDNIGLTEFKPVWREGWRTHISWAPTQGAGGKEGRGAGKEHSAAPPSAQPLQYQHSAAAAGLGTPRVLCQLELLPIPCPPDGHRDGAQLEGGNHCMRSLKLASWGSADPKWMRMQGGKVQRDVCAQLSADSINFALQETICDSLGLSGIHKLRKKEGV